MEPAIQEKIRLSLWESIVTGKIKVVHQIFEQKYFGVNDQLSPVGIRPIHQAILSEKYEMVVMFVEIFNADIEVRDENWRTPLHLAASCGNQRIVDFLVSKNADINAVTTGGETPAMKACYFGQETVLMDLIFKYRCNLQVQNNQGKTVLDLVKVFFGANKYEQMRFKIFNELQEHPVFSGEEIMANGEGVVPLEEEMKDTEATNTQDDPINPTGLHAFSFLKK